MLAYQRSGFLDDFITGTLSCCEITVDGEEMNHDEYSTISSFERGSVEQTAVELAKDVTQYYVSDTTPGVPARNREANRYAAALQRVTDKITDKHSILLDGLVRKLNLTDGNVDIVFKAFQTTVDCIFSDGVYSWGRLGTVYAFAGVLVRHCFRSGLVVEDELDALAVRIGTHIGRKMGTWIRANGGWVRRA